MIRLTVSDFDGTLARRDKTIGEYTRDTIRSYRDAGGIFTIATGRMFEGIRSQLQKTGLTDPALPIVSYQGAKICTADGKNSIREAPLPLGIGSEIVRFCEDRAIFCQSYADGAVVVSRYHPSLDFYCRVNVVPFRETGDLASFLRGRTVYKVLTWSDPERIDETEDLLRREFGTACNVCRSSRHFVECFSFDAGKENALTALCDYFGVPVEETMAFGDQYNDLEMIRRAGIGVAVANAEEALKQAADRIAPDCDNEGVARVIAEYNHLGGTR